MRLWLGLSNEFITTEHTEHTEGRMGENAARLPNEPIFTTEHSEHPEGIRG